MLADRAREKTNISNIKKEFRPFLHLDENDYCIMKQCWKTREREKTNISNIKKRIGIFLHLDENDYFSIKTLLIFTPNDEIYTNTGHDFK